MATTDPTAVTVIDVRIPRVESLFETLDPSPFHERDLDPRAIDYILGWAQEYPAGTAFLLRFHLPDTEAARAAASDIGPAIRMNFGYWIESVERDRRELFRRGRRYLAIGLTVLALSTLIRKALPALLGDTPVAGFLAEGLYILGWVSNWKPLEIFLYDWWPLYRRLGLYRRLAAAQVQIVAPQHG